ncbi:MAG: hypothetical protein LBS31_08830 [Candidatus Adiutrix sp.]|jgi:flagellar motility protein MotE (MotC chaperone)|nr:hypothetical protein [Candidatus Adiutrix sp.]
MNMTGNKKTRAFADRRPAVPAQTRLVPAQTRLASPAQTRPVPAQTRPGAAGPKNGSGKAGKKTWPILEIALFLLLVKIAAVTYYMAAGGQPEDSAALQLKHIEEKIAAEGSAGDLKAPAHNAAASVNDYIAAAAAAVSPASAAAAAPAAAVAQASTAAMSSNAIVAGAFMVVAAQSSGPEAAGSGASSIPLPPDGGDLLVPAASLPEPTLPRIPAAPGASLADPALANLDYDTTIALRARERELSQREASLTSRAEALTSLENEMKKRQEAIEAARAEIEAMTQRNEAILSEQKALREQQQKDDEALKDARIQHLVVAYKGMKPDAAGNLVNSLDDDVAVAILSAMPGRNAGQILAFVNPDKAARLTKAISERRIDPNLLLADGPEAD